MKRLLLTIALVVGACGGSDDGTVAATGDTATTTQAAVVTTTAAPTTAPPTTVAPTTTTTEPDFLASLTADQMNGLQALCEGQVIDPAVGLLRVQAGELPVPPDMLAALEAAADQIHEAGFSDEGFALLAETVEPHCADLEFPVAAPDAAVAEPTDGLLDGTYTVSLDTFTGVLADVEPFERTFTFVADCSTDPCTITGMIEHASGTAEVSVAHDGDSYVWELDNVETFIEDGVTLCEWGHHLTYKIWVTVAADSDGLWTAESAQGLFDDFGTVLEEAPNVSCGGGEGGGAVSLERLS